MKKEGYGPMDDILYDVKEYAPGSFVAVGLSGDTSNTLQSLLLKFDNTGKIILNKMYTTNYLIFEIFNSQELHSVTIAKNGDFLVRGKRFIGPLVMRLDQDGNIKWTYWFYDSLQGVSGKRIDCDGSVDSIRETSRGTIICAIGYNFTDDSYIFGDKDYNCAGYLELDSLGNKRHGGELNEGAGYNIGGSSIEETPDGSFLVAGNQTLNYVDTGSNTKWHKSYNFQLDGVGRAVNNISKCKKLRDNSFMVAGQAYEGNCWKDFEKLYYDAWWSPVNYRNGTIATWDTAGHQGGHDELYDFPQLNNGNLVFIGIVGGTGKLWTFVTDSTGSKILWEQYQSIPYKSRSFTPTGISVCATSDSGFTVVGKINFPDTLGGVNGFIAHYIPREKLAVGRNISSRNDNIIGFSIKNTGSRLIIRTGSKTGTVTDAALFDCRGKYIAKRIGKGEVAMDLSKMSFGTYIVRVKADGAEKT